MLINIQYNINNCTATSWVCLAPNSQPHLAPHCNLEVQFFAVCCPLWLIGITKKSHLFFRCAQNFTASFLASRNPTQVPGIIVSQCYVLTPSLWVTPFSLGLLSSKPFKKNYKYTGCNWYCTPKHAISVPPKLHLGNVG